MKLIFLLLFCFVGFGNLSAQRDQYSLLWEISGNGLQKPSYLFGTMHVRDERAFDFPDSLLTVLHNCEAYAMECDLDSVLLSIFSEPNDEESDSSKWLLNQLDSAEMEDLRGRTRQLFGTEMEDMPNYNPLQMNYLFGKGGSEMPGKDDHSTFLDLYLYDIANREGKKMCSLEKPDTYNDLYLFSFLKKETKDSLLSEGPQSPKDALSGEDRFAKMFDLYYEGRVEQLWAYMMGNLDQEYLDLLLFKRNIIMVNEIDRLLKKHTTFIAMGAGHLPGEKGVIQLLRNRGFKVRRVTPQFTGKSKKYVVEEKRSKWQTFDVPEKGYSIETPGNLYPIYIEGLKLLDPHFAMDWGKTVNYMTMCRSSETVMFEGAKAKKDIINGIYENMSGQRQFRIKKRKELGTEAFPGVEVSMSDFWGNYFYRFQVWVGDHGLYLLMCSAQDSVGSTADQDRFFNSLKTRAPKVPEGQAEAAHWYKFSKKDLAFQILAPQKMKLNVRESSGREVDVKLYETVHNNQEFGVFSMKLPTGRSSKLVKDSLIALMVEQYSSTFGELVYMDSLPINGFEARTAHYKHMGSVTQLKMALRKNMLIIAYTSATDSIANKFMGSFQVDTMAQPVFDKAFSNSNFSVMLPKKATSENIDYFDHTKFASAMQAEAFDVGSNSSYSVRRYELNPFLNIKDSLAVINDFYTAYFNSDTLHKDSVFKYKGHLCQELRFQEIESEWKTVERKILTGNNLYIISSKNLEEFPTKTDAFFNSLTFKMPEVPGLAPEQKLRSAMSAITNKSSKLMESALLALNSYDIPADVADSLLAMLPDAQVKAEDKHLIISAVSNNKTPWATQKLNRYMSHPAVDDTVKCYLLGGLCKQENKEAYQIVAKYLQDGQVMPDIWQQWEINFNTRDSALLESVYPELSLLALTSNEWGFKALDAFVSFADSSHYLDKRLEHDGPTYSTLLGQLSKQDYGADDYVEYSSEGGRKRARLLSLLKLKIKMNAQPQDQSTLEGLIKSIKPEYIRYQAIELYFLKFGTVPKKAIHDLAKGTYFLELYRLLDKHHRLDLLPKKYMKQDFLVKILMIGTQDMEEIYLDTKTIKALGARASEHEGQPTRNYLFTGSASYEETTENYLVILGPQPNDDKKFEHKRFICRYYYSEGAIDNNFIETSYQAFLEDLKAVNLDEEGYYIE